ncbi:MAG TPA: AprI/Inh family metalloprotease inhibitor [Rhizomicrobium sp.]
MSRISSLVLGTALALSTIALAHADPAVSGTWKLSVGANDAPCTLTLADAGAASPSPDCTGDISTIGSWKTVGPSLQLYSPGGELVAWLNPKGDTFAGTRTSDGRKVALDR